MPSDDRVKAKIYLPLINSCSEAEMMLLRWALCSRQSFSASSQVCLCVKYLWVKDHRSRYTFHIQPGRFKCYRTPGLWRITLTGTDDNADKGGKHGRGTRNVFEAFFFIIPTCSSGHGTSSNRAHSLLCLRRWRKKREGEMR